MGIRNMLSRLRGRGEQRVYPPTWLPGALQALLGGGKSHSGITITEAKALTYPAFYAAVDLIAQSIGELPLHVYERQGESRKKAVAHPVYDLLHTRPNAEQTSFVWRQSCQGWILTWGNMYAEIARNGAGRPVALWPIPPTRIRLERRGERGALVYVQTDDKGRVVAELLAENVLHVHGLGDGLLGWSPVTQFREAIGLGLAAEQYGSAFFGNDARPGGILEHPNKLGDKALVHLRESWESAHAGPANVAKPAILEEGMTWKQVGIPNDDAQFLETRTFSVREIARIFHIPPHKLGDLADATYSNVEQMSIDYVQHCLAPWLKAWEQECDCKLFSAAERRRYYTKFNVAGLLRGDAAARAEFYAKQWNIGAMSQNEIRALEELNPIEGGDQHFVPMNMIPADRAGEQLDKAKEPPPEPPEEGDGDGDGGDTDANALPLNDLAAHRTLLVDLCGRVVNKEVTALRRAALKPESLAEAIDVFYMKKDHASHVVHVLRTAIAACAAAMGVPCDGYVKDFADGYIMRAHGRFWGVTEGRIPAALDEWEAQAPERMATRILHDLRKRT